MLWGKSHTKIVYVGHESMVILLENQIDKEIDKEVSSNFLIVINF